MFLRIVGSWALGLGPWAPAHALFTADLNPKFNMADLHQKFNMADLNRKLMMADLDHKINTTDLNQHFDDQTIFLSFLLEPI